MLARLTALAAVATLVLPATAAAAGERRWPRCRLRCGPGLYEGPVDGVAARRPTARCARSSARRASPSTASSAPPPRRAGPPRPSRARLRVLARGLVGWDVAAVQWLLAWHGFPSGRFDGRLRAAPTSAPLLPGLDGLAPDGRAGTATFAALRRAAPASPLRMGARRSDRDGRLRAARQPLPHRARLPAPAGTPVVAGASARHLRRLERGRLRPARRGRARLGRPHVVRAPLRIDVVVGQRVAEGTQLGLVGSTGASTGPHLHWEVRVRGACVDPADGARLTQPAGHTALHSTRDGPPRLPRDAVRVVAAALRQRARRGRRARAAPARARGHRRRAVEPRRRPRRRDGALYAGSSEPDVIAPSRLPCPSRAAPRSAWPSAPARASRSRSPQGRFDVVHGFEPGLPSLSYLALRDAQALTVATFLSPERLGYPPGRRSASGCSGGSTRSSPPPRTRRSPPPSGSPGDYRIIRGVDTDLFRPGPKRSVIVLEWRTNERRSPAGCGARAGGAGRLGAHPAPHEAARRRPYVPRALRDRVTVRTAPTSALARRCSTRPPSSCPRSRASRGSALEAAPRAPPSRPPPRVDQQPELAAAAMARLAEDDELRAGRARRAPTPSGTASRRRAGELDELYAGLATRDAARAAPPATRSPTARGSSSTCTCTRRGRTTARSRSPTCSTTPRTRGSARSPSPTTTSSAAREAGGRARPRPRPRRHPRRGGQDRRPGRGDRALPRAGRSRAACPSPTRSPRSRSRAASSTSPTPSTGCTRSPTRRPAPPPRRHRRVRGLQRPAALRVLQRRGAALRAQVRPHRRAPAPTRTSCRASAPGAVRMRAFRDSEEFLISLHTAEVLRRPKSLVYLQGLKWVAQAQGKGPPAGDHSGELYRSSPTRPLTGAGQARRAP